MKVGTRVRVIEAFHDNHAEGVVAESQDRRGNPWPVWVDFGAHGCWNDDHRCILGYQERELQIIKEVSS